jgi:hypothetical protein
VTVVLGGGYDIVESHDIATPPSTSHKPMSGNGGPRAGRRAAAPRPPGAVDGCHIVTSRPVIAPRAGCRSFRMGARAGAVLLLCGVLCVMRKVDRCAVAVSLTMKVR